MKLIDMLAGKKSDDPKDRPSGVKIMVEPTVGLLETIDDFRKGDGGSASREAAFLAYAALGVVSKKAVGSLMSLFTDHKNLDAEKDELRTKELRLAEAVAKKDALEEAAKVCDAIAADYEKQSESGHDHDHDPWERKKTAEACAEAIRAIKQRVVSETLNDRRA